MLSVFVSDLGVIMGLRSLSTYFGENDSILFLDGPEVICSITILARHAYASQCVVKHKQCLLCPFSLFDLRTFIL